MRIVAQEPGNARGRVLWAGAIGANTAVFGIKTRQADYRDPLLGSTTSATTNDGNRSSTISKGLPRSTGSFVLYLNYLGLIFALLIDIIEIMGSTSSRNDTFASERPSFHALPLRKGDPKASTWGLWGDDDELGTLNLLTPSTVKSAAAEVVTGETVALNLPLNAFVQPMNPVRKPCSHNIIAKGKSNDDVLDINTQGSSHWDGPRHCPYQDTLQYYNGVTQDDITGPTANAKIGIQNIAKKTITGRGVLLDWSSWATEQGIQIDHFDSHGIPLSQLQAVAASQGVEFHPGDILLIRTGWLPAYNTLSDDQKAALPHRPVRSSCGVEASEDAIRWHWNNAFAAVASDTVAYEAWPSPRPWGVSMHEVFLGGWGMPIGESFDLEGLAAKCRALQRWSFMFVSVSLDVPGGVASPPGAVAIF